MFRLRSGLFLWVICRGPGGRVQVLCWFAVLQLREGWGRLFPNATRRGGVLCVSTFKSSVFSLEAVFKKASAAIRIKVCAASRATSVCAPGLGRCWPRGLSQHRGEGAQFLVSWDQPRPFVLRRPLVRGGATRGVAELGPAAPNRCGRCQQCGVAPGTARGERFCGPVGVGRGVARFRSSRVGASQGLRLDRRRPAVPECSLAGGVGHSTRGQHGNGDPD